MGTVKLILFIVTLHLAINLMTALRGDGFSSKQKDDIALIFTYLEKNGVDHLGLLKSFFPETETALMRVEF